MIMNRSDSLGLFFHFLLHLLFLFLLLNSEESAFRVESSLEGGGLLVVGGDLGNLGEVFADTLKEGP